jgi:four helix bundle protein
MPKIERFEDLNAWQASRELVNQIYSLSREKNFSRDYGLTNQITRSVGSVMHNIAEGFDAGSDRQFMQFLGFARRSASEVQSQLYNALDQGYVTKEQFDIVYTQTTKTKRIINGLISYLASSTIKQIKESNNNYDVESTPVYTHDFPNEFINAVSMINSDCTDNLDK